MSDWRKAAGVLRGAIPPGETPESMIRRMRDGDEPTDADRALAVLDRIVRDDATYVVEMHLTRDGDAMRVIVWQRDGSESPYGDGPTPAAALLALGARWEGGDA